MNEELKAVGSLCIERFNNGKLLETRELKNLVVTTGRSYITSRMRDASTTVMSHIAVGTGAVAPATGNTTLGTETGRSAGTTSQQTTLTTDDTYQISATFAAGIATGALTEAGIFNAGSGGIMASRVTFPVVNKAADDAITITWKIQIT
jgi:hypothetical protein